VAHLDLIKRAIVSRRPGWVNVALLVLALAIATGLRMLIDRAANGVPFLTFYPVILLAAILLGARYAVAAAIASALIVSRVLMTRPWLSDNDPERYVIIALYAVVILMMVSIGQAMRLLVLESEAHARQAETFNAELQHRTKNALQIMRALIARGPRGEDPQVYFRTLAGRLDAFARANEVLRFGVLESAGCEVLVRAAISPFDDGRITLSGPDCHVSREAATPLVMALHELCTNAIKYGALSAEAGTVWLGWETAAAGQEVQLTWIEQGGPPVTPPRHRGLGSRLLVANGGLSAVDLDWRREGLCCRITAQAAKTGR
jgi:two-component sensor histidine kinase